MPLKVERRPNENNSRLVHRFNRKVRNSGILEKAKKKQTFEKPKSDNQKKEDALEKKKRKEEFKRKRKLGEL